MTVLERFCACVGRPTVPLTGRGGGGGCVQRLQARTDQMPDTAPSQEKHKLRTQVGQRPRVTTKRPIVATESISGRGSDEAKSEVAPGELKTTSCVTAFILV